MRLDFYLVNKGFCRSREMAKDIIIKGFCGVNGKAVLKPSKGIGDNDDFVLKQSDYHYFCGM